MATPTPKGSIAKLVDPKRLIPKMTPEDAAMFKLLQKRYPDLYPKKRPGLQK